MSEPQTLSAGKPIPTRAELLDALAADGLIDAADARRLCYAPRTREGVARHPVNFVADQQLVAPADARPLGVERLLAWLGEESGQAVYQIDPLKINVTAVAEVMSRAFAERHRILAVEVTSGEVVIASAEPYLRGWESNLEHVSRKRRAPGPHRPPAYRQAHGGVLHHGGLGEPRPRR